VLDYGHVGEFGAPQDLLQCEAYEVVKSDDTDADESDTVKQGDNPNNTLRPGMFRALWDQHLKSHGEGEGGDTDKSKPKSKDKNI
jgi:hypothetical protein